MALFASKTPRDLNHDPLPWRIERLGIYLPTYRSGATFDPRPEFDHVQHNEPNPILVAHRQYRGNVIAEGLDPIKVHLEELAFASEIYGRVDFEDGSHANEHHIDHARRVLTRLARLEARS